MRCLN